MESVPILQERIVTDRTEQKVKHSLDSRFVLNMHALHNAHSIWEVLPRSLSSPVPYLQDRLASHTRFAEQLRITGPAKRTATRAKTQETRTQNKLKKATMASAQVKQHAENVAQSGNEMDDDEGMDIAEAE
jgi:hypothetical protein